MRTFSLYTERVVSSRFLTSSCDNSSHFSTVEHILSHSEKFVAILFASSVIVMNHQSVIYDLRINMAAWLKFNKLLC